MKHYSKTELENFRNGDMTEVRSKKCRMHLDICEKCRNLLQELYIDDKFIDLLKRAVELFKDNSNRREKTLQKLRQLFKSQ